MYGSNGFSLGSLKMSYQFSFIQEIVLKVGLTNFEKWLISIFEHELRTLHIIKIIKKLYIYIFSL